jgi:hypothetical protein
VTCERGQATIEWVGLVLLASLALGAAAAVAGDHVDGRSFGGFVAHRIVCAVRANCGEGDAALARTYGAGDAELLRRHTPDIVYEPGERELPVDYRECRRARCAKAPDDRDLDAHRTNSGRRATVYTRVIRRNGRTYLQYWLYYPDSNSTWAGSDKLWRGVQAPLGMRRAATYPGFHLDDWEGYQVRIDRRGRTHVRVTSHGHYQWCKQKPCRNRWGAPTGWTRVSRGSHAGHIPLERHAAGLRGARGLARFRPRYRARLPGRDMRERTTTGEGLRLVPLEAIDRRRYRRLAPGIAPPWQKPVYRHPEDHSS